MNPNPTGGVQQIFGTVKPPGPQALTDPVTGISKLLTTAIQFGIFIGAILLLGYLLYGAFQYITSGGDEEKAGNARKTITYAIVGIILMVVGLAIFAVIAGDVLGIITRDKSGNIYFRLPTLQ